MQASESGERQWQWPRPLLLCGECPSLSTLDSDDRIVSTQVARASGQDAREGLGTANTGDEPEEKWDCEPLAVTDQMTHFCFFTHGSQQQQQRAIPHIRVVHTEVPYVLSVVHVEADR